MNDCYSSKKYEYNMNETPIKFNNQNYIVLSITYIDLIQ